MEFSDSQITDTMRAQRCPAGLVTILVLLSGLFGLGPLPSAAEEPTAHEAHVTLPLSEVILYSSGVGYFQRDGQVDGKASVELQFKVEDINDLLKSMVVQDLDGGQISTVTYGSRDPLTKTLKSFGIDLTSNPTLGQLLEQVRGERVQVQHPNLQEGTVLGVERKTEHLDDKRTVEN